MGHIEVPLLAGQETPLAAIENKNNVVLRGLEVRHANPRFETAGLSVRGCRNVLIENCRTDWNGGVGLSFVGTRNLTIKNCVANHNGGKGMNGVTGNSLIEDCETSWNNWRGAQSGFLGWASAAIKVARVNNLVFRRHVAVGNETGGIWFDISC